MNALVYVDIKLLEMKNEKNYAGFLITYISIANFEAFFWNLNLSTNRLFWRCVLVTTSWHNLHRVQCGDLFIKLYHQYHRLTEAEYFYGPFDTYYITVYLLI